MLPEETWVALGISVREASRVLGISVWRVYQLIRSKQVAARKSGGMWLVFPPSIKKRLQKRGKGTKNPREGQKGPGVK